MMGSAGDVIMLPAWKLLRPLNDPIASAIPANVRQQLLALDPCITNLGLFFPDSGADLAQAANPTADPSANERAELIRSWWPDTGIELNYTFGQSQELKLTTTQEIDLTSGVALSLTAGAKVQQVQAALSITGSDTTSVGYQSSKETTNGSSVSASCMLIRNQNDRDLAGIEVYFDRVFSTLMFRKILADHCRITGRVLRVDNTPLSRARIFLESPAYYSESYTDTSGQYRLSNVPPSEYTLRIGDQVRTVILTEGPWTDPIRLDIDGVRQVIDLAHCTVGQLTEALGLDLATVQKMIAVGVDWGNLRRLVGFTGIKQSQVDIWEKTIVFVAPSSSSNLT